MLLETVSFSLTALLEYLTVIKEYIDALAMQHGICIGDLAPAPLTPGSAAFESYTLQYNVHSRGYILSMVITKQALMII